MLLFPDGDVSLDWEEEDFNFIGNESPHICSSCVRASAIPAASLRMVDEKSILASLIAFLIIGSTIALMWEVY